MAVEVTTEGFLLSRVTYGEADLIVHLFTKEIGRIAALARGARRSQKRFSGSLEPMHTLKVTVSEKPGSELHTLKESSIETPRLRLTQSLPSLEAAGRALSWIRKAAPAATQEARAYQALEEFFNELNTLPPNESVQGHLAAFGARLVSAFGWGLELSQCISCDKPCPDERPALISPERGGLICLACGGGPIRLAPDVRSELKRAAAGQTHLLSEDSIAPALRIVERALGAHLGIG